MLSSRGVARPQSSSQKLVSVDGSRPSRRSKDKAPAPAPSESRARPSIVLHRHSHSRSPEHTARRAPIVHVEAKLSALACKSLSSALKDLHDMIGDWIHKYYPKSLKKQRFDKSEISMETAQNPQWAAIFDLDETVLHYSEGAGIKSTVDKECRVPRDMYTFLNFLRSQRIKIVYITARRDRMKDETQATLESMRMWRPDDLLVLKPESWPPESSSLYKHHARQLVEQRGYSIILNSGDQFSDLMVWTKWRNFMERIRTELPEDHILRVMASRIRTSDSGTNQLKQLAAIIDFPIIFFALEANIPFALKLPQQEFFTK